MMPRFWWLTYRRARRLVGVIIMDAPALIQALVKAAVRGVDIGAPFGEGHVLSAELAAGAAGADRTHAFGE